MLGLYFVAFEFKRKLMNSASANVANGRSITLLRLLLRVQKERALDVNICH